MSDIISIEATERCELGTAASRRLRRAGLVPVVVYSHGKEAKALTLTAAEAAKIQYHNGLLELAVENGEKFTAVVKEVQVHALNLHIQHIDFQAVNVDEVIESVVSLEGTGEAAGTRSGGQLEQALLEVTIKSKPTEIPEKILVDVSGIELDQALHVRDIVAPAGVEIVSDGDLVVFHVRAVKSEAAEEAPAEESK